LGPPPCPPYQLVVTTLLAHESALDPRVHRLYWDYQHVVHQDADPLAAVPGPNNNDAMNSNSSNNIGEHHSSLDDDDDDDDSSERWGREHAPAGWREKALDMLSHEYQHLTAETQRRLVKSFAAFYEFLVENPFDEQSRTSSAPTDGKVPVGTYHQHYILSGNVLVAVGVVDVLPTGLSSVYLFYSPSFAHQLVPLGKYAILREIEWTKEAGLPYYYLGYYIESCPKMNYKGDYHPSELLCPTTYKWVDAEVAKAIIQKDSPEHHCCTLYKAKDASDKTNGAQLVPKTVDEIPIEVGFGTPVTLGLLHQQGQEIVRPLLQEFMDQAGPEIVVQCTVNFG
jgi:Arginine-tRNA-protein transferase, C terminus